MPKAKETRPHRDAFSRFKGVRKIRGRWCAIVYENKKQIHIGTFNTEEEAARSYDEAALARRGPGTFLNLRDLAGRTQPVVERGIARIRLSCGKHFVIDAGDVALVSQHYWYIAGGTVKTQKPVQRNLSTLLLRATSRSEMVMHLDGDPLNFRRNNILVIPRSLGAGANKKRRTGSSRYKGVHKTREGRWAAKIAHQYIGTFDDEIDAAYAYDSAARDKYDLFAAVNFPREGEFPALLDEESL